ncbi:enoyl-CoA hydratase/isomerase family protein [Thalassotalea sp. M1531]|uniref:Enoyl-CoA hydratase/isomerase family protein n=1 Tax=Thalassotalea algicola TaxID=2716224 RepID=A0A7Y0Q677_9GAMM|nr:enoyl-CoA hydratase/isomerase family protein [Thalassotalea algicola]NMP31714.1 enoyl-CoA hydratase/isomerase family protein [Thalassotalea algicola]
MNDLNLADNLAKCIETSLKEGVLTITMNQPNKLNGWTIPMMEAFKTALDLANKSDNVKAIVFTGTGRYYSAGVNLSSAVQLMHPKKLQAAIFEHNLNLFDTFINVEKPILVAVNGPAIGASVTTATLCNYIIAAEEATFSTPFAALGVPPEGCSSVHFPRLMGSKNAQLMLGDVGWRPTAQQGLSIGLVQKVVPQTELQSAAFNIAKSWVETGQQRAFLAGSNKDELKRTNYIESKALANAFLSRKFLLNQAKFLWSKKKYGLAAAFFIVTGLRPLWARLL